MADTPYERNKRWRQLHPKARHNGKGRNYDRGAGPQHRARQPWTQEEEAMILARTVSDRELAVKIGRTVRAIQIHRCRLQPSA